jgi:hypothetical protein
MGTPRSPTPLYVPLYRLENFQELQVSARSGSPITLSWQNPFMKPQRVEGGNPQYRERNKQTKKPFKKKLRGHSQTPCSGPPLGQL